MSATTLKDPRRYFEAIAADRNDIAASPPVCLYLEVTNRCNLLCETCPRTFEELEPPADMSWDLFTKIVDQVPNVARVVLHGVGEPMLVRNLPKMIRYLKDRGTYVLFNTNGTLLNPKKFQEIIDTGLDELRVSFDAASPETYELVRGADGFGRIVQNLRDFDDVKRGVRAPGPKVSLWITGMKSNVRELPALVELAHEIGVGEVYLQRLVYSERGLAAEAEALYGRAEPEDLDAIQAAQSLADRLGVTLRGSGEASSTGLLPAPEAVTYRDCRRPWSLMYVTANGNVLPCCIAPFTGAHYEGMVLGNVFEETVEQIWNGARYQSWRAGMLEERPPEACAGCGAGWSL